MDEDKWGGKALAMELLGCTSRVLMTLVDREVIPKTVAVKVGRAWTFNLTELARLRDTGGLSYE